MRGNTADGFAVDEDGMTSDGYRRLDPICVKAMYISRAISLVVLLAVLAVAYIQLRGAPEREIVWFAFLAIFVVCAVYCAVSPQVFFRRYRYRLDDDKLEIRRGIITISHVLVPIERIHQVEVQRGPINRAFGLADVIVTTAGGVVRVQMLEEDVAERIADRLNETVIGILRSRERGWTGIATTRR